MDRMRVGGFWFVIWLFPSLAFGSADAIALKADGPALKPSRAAIASAHPLASEAGVEILAAGGNAFDAAIAVSAARAVVEPYSSGIGGGGFWLLHRVSDGHEIMIDAREMAPSAASKDMYLDADGEVLDKLARNGPLSAGIPGLVAGFQHLADNYGKLSLADSLAPAIHFAREGFTVGPRYKLVAGFRIGALQQSPAAAEIFLVDGKSPPIGHIIRQPDLAATLEAVASGGAPAFYDGHTAERLVKGVRDAGGIWTLKDLGNYRIVERPPIVARYRNMRIVSAPPPSSGGIVLTQALNILEGFDLNGLDETTRHHVVVEAMRRAYRDRAGYLGDSDFVDVPIVNLTAKPYAAELRGSIDLARATPSSSLPGLADLQPEGRDTTHFSLIDADGNRVAGTLSINLPFGSAFMPPGTGVILNDEMDDFSAKAYTPNAYGLIGVHANAIAPGKRPLSSMTPTFIETDERIGILGTPGGSRIISMVLLGVLDFEKGRPPSSWVRTPRFHHQYMPDEVQFEKDGLSEVLQANLEQHGHHLKENSRNYGNMHAVLWDRTTGEVSAASDPRGEGGVAYFSASR